MKKDYRTSVYPKGKRSGKVECWRLDFVYKDKNNNGKEETYSPRFDTRSEAVAERDKLISDYKNQTGMFAPIREPQPEPIKPVTFREYAAEYLEKLLKRTKSKSYISEMRVLNDYFGDRILAELKRKDIEAFEEWLDEQTTEVVRREIAWEYDEKKKTHEWTIKETKVLAKLDWSTKNHFYKRLSAMNNQAILDEVPNVGRINFAGFKKPKLENVRKVTVNYSELEILLENCYKPNLCLEVLGLFETGSRLSELKSITRSDFDNDEILAIGQVLNSKKKISDRITKRPVYFSKRLRQAIYDYHGVTEEGFKRLPAETPIFDPRSLRTAWEGLRKRVALKYAEKEDTATANKILNLQEKDFRTSHRTNLKNARIMDSFRDVQTGHNQDSITARHYEHSDYEAIVEEFELYEAYSERMRAKIKERTATAEQSAVAAAS